MKHLERWLEFLKKHKFISLLIVLTTLNCGRFLCTGHERAVLLPEAWIRSLSGEYFIVWTYPDWGYYYWNGTERVPVYVTGKSPTYELAAPVSGDHVYNKFLIKGYLDEELSETAGKAVLWAQDWEIIAPIHRDFNIDDENRRITGPRYFFDNYDIETGLYQPAADALKVLEWYEVEHIKKNSEKDCLLVASEYCDDKLKWYIPGEWDVPKSELTPVNLQGYDFEQTFSTQILDSENCFLVCGRNETEQGIFWVEEWYIVAPVYGKTTKPWWKVYNYYRSGGFSQEDVEAGYYIPQPYNIFYKKYKDGIRTNKDVTYPWITGLGDEELEQKVNTLLYETATSNEVFTNGDYQQDITYEVMRADEDVLSVVFHEFTINDPTTYCYYDNYGVTIDMHTGETMQFTDFISMEELEKKFLAGQFTSEFSDIDELEPEWLFTFYKEESEHKADFFVKESGVGIIIQIGKYSVIFELKN